ncbi:hypothetical protein [Exiguobacterium sp. UBA5002]|uniref:hypothetical protein n=1 Tax=Exiguobacterium sp. UBA5002 TaxID=1946497 RepID=UPI0025BD815E|nr:hypothetical protein [Exiguobacterium sp. UBA5002]
MLSIVKNSFISAILFAFLYALIAGFEMGDPAIYDTSFTDFFMIGLLFAGPAISQELSSICSCYQIRFRLFTSYSVQV